MVEDNYIVDLFERAAGEAPSATERRSNTFAPAFGAPTAGVRVMRGSAALVVMVVLGGLVSNTTSHPSRDVRVGSTGHDRAIRLDDDHVAAPTSVVVQKRSSRAANAPPRRRRRSRRRGRIAEAPAEARLPRSRRHGGRNRQTAAKSSSRRRARPGPQLDAGRDVVADVGHASSTSGGDAPRSPPSTPRAARSR